MCELTVGIFFRKKKKKISSQESSDMSRWELFLSRSSVPCRPCRECSSTRFIDRGHLFPLASFITKPINSYKGECDDAGVVPPLHQNLGSSQTGMGHTQWLEPKIRKTAVDTVSAYPKSILPPAPPPHPPAPRFFYRPWFCSSPRRWITIVLRPTQYSFAFPRFSFSQFPF